MRSTIFDSSEKEKTAAAEMLITPAMVVASRMEESAGSILSLGGYATKLQIKAQTGYFGNWPMRRPPKTTAEIAAFPP